MTFCGQVGTGFRSVAAPASAISSTFGFSGTFSALLQRHEAGDLIP